MGGEAGNTIYDPTLEHIFVAVQARKQVVEIDPRMDRVIARHALAAATQPHGMVLDAPGRLLFIANEGSATLLTFDLRTMRVIDRRRVGQDPDVLAFDPVSKRLYVSSESGLVSVFTEQDRRLVHEGDITMPHAHTVSVDPRTHLVYFPLQDVDGRPMLRIMIGRHTFTGDALLRRFPARLGLRPRRVLGEMQQRRAHRAYREIDP